jgi:NAD(P)-dependent dehydrogenase (short-subunit alcohol dehydrogenase family)
LRRRKPNYKSLSLRAGLFAGIAAAAVAARVLAGKRRYSLSEKTVFIAGGSRGLGLLMAREFARRGARVAICARDAGELERARWQLLRSGCEVFTVVCDLTLKDEVDQAIRRVKQEFGRIDILVNNAGVIQVGPAEVMQLEDYQESLDTHFWAPLYTTLAVLPDMKTRGQGRIVNISSIGGKLSVPHLLPYSVGKFALTGFSEGLRAEAAKDNVLVTTVCPGLMRTGSPRNAKFKGKHRAEYAWFSISAGLPLLSIGAERAARRLVTACERGEAEVILSLPAKLAVLLHGIFPGLTSNIFAIGNRWMPSAEGGTSEAHLGEDSFSKVSPSALTVLNERAARRNNEVA